MAVTAGVAFIDIVPNTSKLGPQMTKGVQAAGATAGTAGGAAISTGVMKQTDSLGSKIGSKLKTSFSSLGPLLGVTLGAGLAKASLDAAAEAEKVNKQLETALQGLGQVGAEAFGGIVDWANKLQFQTGVDDEEIKTISARLAQMGTAFFKAAGPDAEKALEQVTQGLIDMGAATGKSTQMLMRSLGPAILNTPEKAIPLLQKYGVLTDAQALKIKALSDAGDKAAATQAELNAITDKFGGTAAATATPTEKLGVLFGEIEETIGKALLPVLQTLNAILTPIFNAFSALPGPIQSTLVVVGLAAAAFKLFGGSLSGTLGSLGRLVGILPKVAAETTAVAVAEGEAAAAGKVAGAAGGVGGFTGSLGKLGVVGVIAAGAIYDVTGAIKIYNAIQDTSHANAQARTQDMNRWANEAVNEIILTGQLSKGHAAYIRGLVQEGKTQGSVAALQESLDLQVQQGRISYDQYRHTVQRTGLALNITAQAVAGVTLKSKAAYTEQQRLKWVLDTAARKFDHYRGVVDRLGTSLANLPKNVNTDYTLTTHYLKVGAPPPGTPAGMHAPQIAAASGWHGMVDHPVTFLAGERGPERVDIGPAKPSRSRLAVEVNIDRRRFLDKQDYELKYGGPA